MRRKMKILSVVGARPQFIKLAVFSKELKDQVIVHTGQHYDYEMSKIFFKNLDIPEPDYNLDIGSCEREEQIKRMCDGLEKVFLKEKPDLVIVFGDTNSTLAGALTAAKLKVKLAHIESGMRSFDKTMPEELNRIETDKLSQLLFCSTKTAANNLEKEGMKGKTYVVGDVMIDAVSAASESDPKVLKDLNIKSKEYFVATVHRAGNTDDEAKLRSIIEAFVESGEKIIFPVHPRTEKYLKKYGLKFEGSNVTVVKPLGYTDMIVLEKNANKILTDSGGIQKEAYFFKVPCITLRDTTEWTETSDDGWNVLVGSDKSKIIDAIKNFDPKGPRSEDYGGGKASRNIASKLGQEIV
jgi:UDP-N-acetylglucosamine 2-epimerase